MAYKTFIVSPPLGVSPRHIKGRNLDDALAKAGLDPSIWKELPPPQETEAVSNGTSENNARPEDN